MQNYLSRVDSRDKKVLSVLGELRERQRQLSEARKRFEDLSQYISINMFEMKEEIEILELELEDLYDFNSTRVHLHNDTKYLSFYFRRERLLKERIKQLRNAIWLMNNKQKLANDECLLLEKECALYEDKYHYLISKSEKPVFHDLDYFISVKENIKMILKEAFGKD